MRLSYETMDGAERERVIEQLAAEGLDVTEWHDDANAAYSEHTHRYVEVRIVLEGSMTITADGVAHQLGPGDRLDLDAGRAHSAVVGPNGVHYFAGTGR